MTQLIANYAPSENLQKSALALGINLEKSFQLIGSIFPFELCLQHKIVPLNLVNESVILGMVNSQEVSVLQGVQPLLKSHNYLVKKKSISVEILKKLLAEYLKYKKSQLQKNQSFVPTEFKSLHEQEMLLPPTEKEESSTTLIVENPQKLILEVEQRSQGEKMTDSPLNLSFKYLQKPPQMLLKLPSARLISELLARLIKEKVNQINIENLKDHGRISWQKNKHTELLIDHIPKAQLQSILNEVKKLLFLPPQPIIKMKKMESLRSYKNSKILLRLKLVPSHYGEQGFLYLFWGKTLEDYENYQLNRLGQEALTLTEQLEEKIKQITQRSQFYELPEKDLPFLHQLQDKIYYQIELLSSMIDNHSDTLTRK